MYENVKGILSNPQNHKNLATEAKVHYWFIEIQVSPKIAKSARARDFSSIPDQNVVRKNFKKIQKCNTHEIRL